MTRGIRENSSPRRPPRKVSLRPMPETYALINLNIKSRTILIASISNKALLNLRINADPFTKVIPAGYGQFRKLNRVEIEQKI